MDDPDRPDDDWPDDSWDEADRAYEEKWAGPAEAPDALSDALTGEPDPFTPAPVSPGYVPTRATPKSVSDAYVGGMAAAGPYLGLGVQIAASMALFAGLGYAIDRWLGTSPWGILAGAALGMVGIFVLIVRVAREADAAAKRKR